MSNCIPPCEELKEVKNKLDDPIYGLVALHKKIDSLKCQMEKKFAQKWVERAMAALITLLVIAALYTIFSHSGLTVPVH